MTHTPIDPNDKDACIEVGEIEEESFVQSVAPAYGLPAQMNPERLIDCSAVDLLVGDVLADLKTQRTPFFTAQLHYGMDPQFTVSVNKSDIERYAALDLHVDIYFWVRWPGVQRFGVTIRPMEGVWRTNVEAVLAHVRRGEAPLHRYRSRVNDTRGNKRESYVLDLGWMERLPLVTLAAA